MIRFAYDIIVVLEYLLLAYFFYFKVQLEK